MADKTIPSKYLLFNTEKTKNPAIVVKIDGLKDILSNRPIYTRVRYGDPVIYGMPGLIYGGLRPFTTPDGGVVKSLMSLEGSSLTLSQRLEPEQGKGAVSTLTLSFVDKDKYMTQLVSPGVVFDEILGRQIDVFLGFEEISYPEDFYRIFRGYITGIRANPGLIIMELSDPNFKRRQNLFFQAKTKLTSGIGPSDTSLTVSSTGDFHKQIMGPDSSVDSAVTTYIKIDDEFMSYDINGIPSSTSFTVTRGQRGTTADSHNSDTDVEAWVQIEDHAIDMALKLMLSGWNGPWQEDVTILSIVNSLDPVLLDIPGLVVFPELVDLKRDYGLVEGDYLSITGATNIANNVTNKRIIRFLNLFDQNNRAVVIDDPLTLEYPTGSVASFRSKYDTYPTSCGLRLPENDVDIARHEQLKRTFLFEAENAYRFLISEQETGKTFIETEVYLPLGMYSLTRNGRLSLGLTMPPIADTRLLFLNEDNVLDPTNVAPYRATNNRKFFNEIDFSFDADDGGKFTNVKRILDTESLSLVGISSALPINSKGAKTDKGIETIINKRMQLLLTRYKRGATQIDIKTNWETGSLIESGDVHVIEDEGQLQISNFETGKRDLGTQLYEVIDRSFDLKSGNVGLKFISGVGSEVTDRYATIGPSSVIATGSTQFEIFIQDSFGAIFPGDEGRKWEDYTSLPVLIHNEDYSFAEETILTRVDSANPYKLVVQGLSISPPAGYIVDVPNYPNTANAADNRLWKLVHVSWTRRVTVTSGVSTTSFNVPGGDVSIFRVKYPMTVHAPNFSPTSGEVRILSVIGTLVTADRDLGFIPDSTTEVDLLSFPDKGYPYRFI